MKLFLLLTTLAVLAGCTQVPETPQTPAPEAKVMEESKIMADTPPSVETTPLASDSTEVVGNSENTSPSPDAPVISDTGEVAMMKVSGYMSYDEAKVTEALASGQKVALFFHATWCPSCKALDTNINVNLSSIPSDTLIMKVDYDTATEMKVKYGVTTQHTIVLIDKDMNLISKKLGARTLDEVLN